MIQYITRLWRNNTSLVDIMGINTESPRVGLIVGNMERRIYIEQEPSEPIPYEASEWYKREIREMLGVEIATKDKRPLLLEQSKGEYPLRKSYPTRGYFEKRYSWSKKRIQWSRV